MKASAKALAYYFANEKASGGGNYKTISKMSDRDIFVVVFDERAGEIVSTIERDKVLPSRPILMSFLFYTFSCRKSSSEETTFP